MSASAEDSPLYVAALARGISVLGAFTEGRPALTLPELAEATGLTKSAVQRFAHTLWVLGYLRKHPQTKKFSLAPLSLELGMRYAQTSALVLGGNPFLHSLNRSSQETCSLAEPDGLDMVYVARFATHKQMFVHMPVGKRLPIYCTAAGRAVLSRLDPARARELLAACRRRAFTNTTITDLDALMAEVAFARDQGYARSNSEFYPGDITVSAPVLDPVGTPVGAVNVSVPASRWSFEEAQAVFGPQVVETAHAISASRTIGLTQPFYAMQAPA
ncbi:IclR family transcriptional regulator [Bordetella hinzii]|uniref:IclR family transcriptional regulator n=2 Tax=Bordetella hinzii TaxID=103855 RepID=A0AAN1RSU9_9BORD|nr:IclR family transcriptional regulator [Bordetella hinzii]AKQ54874.1 Pca regulon regulatory protein [Bordetella hinzii]AKQ59387.1 Pca regulon regulatory protein [Bordetella hinzii]AZW15378.1 IclR family transcriptional regulator [Bordetella hinzii]KCB24906.1 transcriptional regulator, IclR family, C-terminal domain protein [Bordetella hinzii OH87 BAL007II]KCB27116.1 transcriptional regulator, IclR family, C-terminal domain protein [Bordetella hinzii CA90 BAL1384]